MLSMSLFYTYTKTHICVYVISLQLNELSGTFSVLNKKQTSLHESEKDKHTFFACDPTICISAIVILKHPWKVHAYFYENKILPEILIKNMLTEF